jgi:murein DD-endopeptidase MepM/ murein hydrolase activator NlpD
MALDLALRFPIQTGSSYTLGRAFGVDPAAYSKIWPGLCGHDGLDIICAQGTPVVAAHAGTVRLGDESPTGYGKYIVITKGAVSTRYAHLSAQTVANGATVAVGQVIGKVGNTGASQGAHLHFEMMVAETNNPCYLNRQDPMLGLLAGGYQP